MGVMLVLVDAMLMWVTCLRCSSRAEVIRTPGSVLTASCSVVLRDLMYQPAEVAQEEYIAQMAGLMFQRAGTFLVLCVHECV